MLTTGHRSALDRGLLSALAVICAAIAANLYYSQPLLHQISSSFTASTAAAGLTVTLTQLGYAAGLLLVVPLGDLLPRRNLVIGLLAADGLALAATAAAPWLGMLQALAVLIGVCSTATMIIIPFAAATATASQRTHVIGTLMSGVLLGILCSRTAAGLLADLVGWRAVYALAAALMIVAALVVARVLPHHSATIALGYRRQLTAIVTLARTGRLLRSRALIGAAIMAAFSCFWTTLTFLLSGPGYWYTPTQIGLFALIGAAGAVTAQRIGRPLDRRPHLRHRLTGWSLIAAMASFLVLAVGAGHGLLWLLLGALVMDMGVQAVHVVNQSMIYQQATTATARLTAVYMTAFFLGGAAGSWTGTRAYQHWDWTGACLTAVAFLVLAALFAVTADPHDCPTRASATLRTGTARQGR